MTEHCALRMPHTFSTRAVGCCAGTFDLLAYTSKDQDVPTDWWVPFGGGWGGGHSWAVKVLQLHRPGLCIWWWQPDAFGAGGGSIYLHVPPFLVV